MRLIGNLDNENDANRFSSFLKRKGIDVRVDGSFDAATGHMSYQIWAYEEDRIAEAVEAFSSFSKTPTNPDFDIPIEAMISPEDEMAMNKGKGAPREVTTPLTAFIIGLCALIFFLNLLQEYPMMREGLSQSTFLVTPIQETLLFDVPEGFERLEEIIEKHQIPPDQKVEDLSPELKKQIEEVTSMPIWKGAYDWILYKVQGRDTAGIEGPMFQRILKGDFWRLFSPAILHTELLHILFNMIWVWVLCRPIEQRIGIFRLLMMTIFVGIGSNVAQYLMGGPFFLGYSGIVMGLAGFTWMREKMAPWEGYPLHRSTSLFLALFVGGMFLVQAVSFVLQLFTSSSFSPNIANTAHIAGGVLGAFLGRFAFFARIR
jgi:GlpG protein